jgi:hypothetical protein
MKGQILFERNLGFAFINNNVPSILLGLFLKFKLMTNFMM